MSNIEEQNFLSDDARFIGLDQIDGISREPVPTPEFVTAEASPRFKPKVATPPATSSSSSSSSSGGGSGGEDLKILNQKLRDVEAAIALLSAGRDGIKLRAEVAKHEPTDWSKVSEKQIFDLSVPVDIVDHTMPDYMKVQAKNSNYVLRWVQKVPRRLGPMRAMGYQYCTKDDIEGELNIAIEPDENGVYRFDDVILMKIEKRIYYGMLRRNYMRALNMVDPKKAHITARDKVVSQMKESRAEGSIDGRTDKTSKGDFDRYVDSNKLSVYAPGMEI